MVNINVLYNIYSYSYTVHDYKKVTTTKPMDMSVLQGQMYLSTYCE